MERRVRQQSNNNNNNDNNNNNNNNKKCVYMALSYNMLYMVELGLKHFMTVMRQIK